MKCVKKGEEIQRVSDEKAAAMVKDGWKYCGKEAWKVIRDANKPKAPEAAENKKDIDGQKADHKSGKKSRWKDGDRRAGRKDYKPRKKEFGTTVTTSEAPPVRKKSTLEILDELDTKQ